MSVIAALNVNLTAATGGFDNSMKSSASVMRQWKREATAAFEATRTPLERYEAEIAKLGRLLDQNLIDFETWRRGVTRATNALDAATPKVQTFGGKLRGMMSGLTSSAGANLAGAFGAYKLASFAAESFAAIDALNDVAQATGTTTERLGALHVAATLNGSSIEQMDAALGYLNKNLGNAEGSKKIQGSLDALGLSAAHLRQIGAGNAIVEISQAMLSIEDPAERARIATDLFGRSGLELLNVLAIGRAGFADAEESAKAYGAAISTVGAENVAAAADAFDGLKLTVQGLFNDLAVEIAPFVKWFSEKLMFGIYGAKLAFLNLAEVIVGGIRSILDAASYLPGGLGGSVASNASEYAGAILEGLEAREQEIWNHVEVLDRQTRGVQEQNKPFVRSPQLAAVAAAIGPASMGGTQAQAAAGFAQFQQDVRGFLAFGQAAIQAGREEVARQGVANLQRDAMNFVDFLKAAKERADKILDEKAAAAIDAAKTPLDKFNQTMNDLEVLKNTGKISEDVYAANKQSALEELDRSTAGAREYRPIAALERGSAAAFSAAMANKAPKTEQEILNQAKEHNALQRETIKAIQDSKPQVAGVRR